MRMPVKYAAQLSAKAWLLFFLATISVIGLLFAYGIATPLHLIGRLWPQVGRLADLILQKAIFFLMSTQPWLAARIEISIPDSRARTTGYLLVSNHRSHLDSFILLSRVPGIRIMAKQSLFFVPFLGIMMWVTKQIPAKRGELDSFLNAMALIRKRLRQGEVVHVFPEMTRCQPGLRGTLKFSTAPFVTAFQEKVPVIPIVFTGTDDAWPKGYWGIHFRRPIVACSLEALDPHDFPDAVTLRDEVKRRIEAKINN